jgi:lipopolysaccharide transport system ATP-binding protein
MAMEAHVDEIVEFAELGEFINRPLRTYSTGMKARLAFAMITQINPEILIIDEALSVGDAAFSVKAGKRIVQLCARGVIVLLVSHSMQSVRDLCNRCLWLSGGRLIMDGPPDKVTRAYAESVREADEAEHIARFRNLVGVRNSFPECGLSALQVTSLDQNIMRLVSGAPLRISCEVQEAEGEIGGVFLLRCIRLDGASICEHQINATAGSVRQTLQISYPKFNLAPGLYRFQLEWLDAAGSQRAEAATVLEVIAEDVPTGGRPVLLGVGDIESEKITEGTKC